MAILNESCISSQISFKFVPKYVHDKSELVPVMACRRTGDKPLLEPMLTQFTDEYMRHYSTMHKPCEKSTICD